MYKMHNKKYGRNEHKRSNVHCFHRIKWTLVECFDTTYFIESGSDLSFNQMKMISLWSKMIWKRIEDLSKWASDYVDLKRNEIDFGSEKCRYISKKKTFQTSQICEHVCICLGFELICINVIESMVFCL